MKRGTRAADILMSCRQLLLRANKQPWIDSFIDYQGRAYSRIAIRSWPGMPECAGADWAQSRHGNCPASLRHTRLHILAAPGYLSTPVAMDWPNL